MDKLKIYLRAAIFIYGQKIFILLLSISRFKMSVLLTYDARIFTQPCQNMLTTYYFKTPRTATSSIASLRVRNFSKLYILFKKLVISESKAQVRCKFPFLKVWVLNSRRKNWGRCFLFSRDHSSNFNLLIILWISYFRASFSWGIW